MLHFFIKTNKGFCVGFWNDSERTKFNLSHCTPTKTGHSERACKRCVLDKNVSVG